MSTNKKIFSIEEINEEVRQFLYIITHDLENPIRGVKQASDFLVADYKDKIGPDGEKILGLLQEKANLLSEMLDDINNYSKVNFKKDQVVDIKFKDILTVVANSINQSISKNLTKNKLHLIQNIDNMTIQSDEVKFSQLLKNLISTLVQFSDETQDEVTCTVSCIKTEDNKNYKFTFACKEIEFDTTRIAKLFEPFQEIKVKSQKINTKMTLALSKKIAESFGGELTVENSQIFQFILSYPIKLAT